MRITKVYTRTGDKGSTGLADGSRISKNHIRIESYGAIDELNSAIAICRQFLNEIENMEARLLVDNWLYAIQNDLFNIGSDWQHHLHHDGRIWLLLQKRTFNVLRK